MRDQWGDGKENGSKNSDAEQNLTFLFRNNDILVVGCSGAATRVSENMRGATLYISYDAGQHFQKMPPGILPCTGQGSGFNLKLSPLL